jgi:hypothetical protein
MSELSESACLVLKGQDGREYSVRKNPSHAELANLGQGRMLLTEHDLYYWHTARLSHRDVARQLGLDGVQLKVETTIAADIEPVGVPGAFPWLYAPEDGESLDIDQRQTVVERWLTQRLAPLAPERYGFCWYL